MSLEGRKSKTSEKRGSPVWQKHYRCMHRYRNNKRITSYFIQFT